MDYDKIKIKYNGHIYKMSAKCWYGDKIVRSFHTTIKDERKQLGHTMFTEQGINEMLNGVFSTMVNH